MKPAALAAQALPYGPLLDQGVVVLHRPGEFGPLSRFALGCVWEITPLNIDLLDESVILQQAQDVKALLLHVPPDSVLDVRLDVRPTNRIPSWEDDRASWTDPHTALIREHIHSGMPHRPGHLQMGLTEVTVTVGFRMPVVATSTPARHVLDAMRALCVWRDAAISAALHERLHALFQAHLLQFLSHADALEMSLRLLGVSPRRLQTHDLVATLNRALSPHPTPNPFFDPDAPLCDQVESPGTWAPNQLATDTHRAHVYVLKKSVGVSYPGMLSAARPPGVAIEGLKVAALRTPVSLVTVIHASAQAWTQKILEIKHMLASVQIQGLLGETRQDTEAKAEDLGELVAAMASGAEHVYDTTVAAVVWHAHGTPPADEVLLRASRALDLDWYREPYLADTLFARTLPMGCDPHYPTEFFTRRARKIPTRTIARLMPVWGAIRSVREPASVYVNRLGEPFFFNLFDRFGAHHTIITGATRRGKSSFLNTHLDQVLPGGEYLAFILDRYGSYDVLAARHQGKLLKFTPENPICIGPFDGDLSPRHREHLQMVIEEMALAGFRDAHVTPDERVAIGDFIAAWAMTGPQQLVLSDFLNFLRTRTESFADRLTRLLSPYAGDGRYAPYVDGPSELGLADAPLWVADIAGLEDMPAIQSVVIAILFTRLEQHVCAPERHRFKKILAADEVSFLLRNQQSAEFLRTLSVALARFFTSFILISQQMSDFLTELGRASVKNADTHIFFNLSYEELSEIQEVFNLSDHMVETIASLRLYEDCSECVVRVRDGDAGVIRVVPPPAFIRAIGQTWQHVEAREQEVAYDAAD
jgi:hypothetical protein